VFGEVEAVEVGALVEDRGLRGVEVFGLGVAEGTPAEADDLAVAAADREEQAAAEAVVVAAPLALGRQAGLGELLRGVAARGEVGEEGVPGLGGEAEAEALQGWARQAAAGDVAAPRLAGGHVEQHVGVEGGRLGVEGDDALAGLVALRVAHGGGAAADLDAG